MWEFFNGHPLIAAIALGLMLVICMLIVILLIKGIRTGSGVEAEAGKSGIKFKVGGKLGKNKEELEAELISNAAFLSSSIINWKTGLSKEIEKKQNDTVSYCVRYAVSRIENLVNVAKLEYGEILKKEKEELNSEDNYQIIIFGFIMDQVKEIFKDQICGAIRADHFEEKTEQEIKSIGENCFLGAKLIFEQKTDILKGEILRKIAEKYESKVKKESDELIDLTMQKYKSLKKDIEETVKGREEKFRAELKVKFPTFTEDITDSLVNYYG